MQGGEGGTIDLRLKAQRCSVVSIQVADIKGREVCRSHELSLNLPLDVLTSHSITLTLGNSGISLMSLSSGPVFMVLQTPKTLNHTKDPLQ